MRRRVGLTLSLAVLLTAAPAGVFSAASVPSPTYLILPFENTAEDRSLDWLSTGLALSLGEYLRGFGAGVVDEEERAVLLEGSGIPTGAPLTLASSLELGRRMRSRPGAARPDRTIIGRFNVSEGELTLSARLIDLALERARPWVSRKGRLRDLLEVQNSLALAMAKEDGLEVEDGRSETLHKQVGDLPLLAFETYCRAMAESDSKKRLHLLRRAIQEYPGYPKAAYQAAALLAKSERWDEAAETLGKAATEPYPYVAEFHLLTASVALQRRDPQAAAQAARRALERADNARGHLLLARALLAQGDRDAATAELDKAAALDPTEPEVGELRRSMGAGAGSRKRGHRP